MLLSGFKWSDPSFAGSNVCPIVSLGMKIGDTYIVILG